jgi:hypothetical protein
MTSELQFKEQHIIKAARLGYQQLNSGLVDTVFDPNKLCLYRRLQAMLQENDRDLRNF